MGSPTTEDLCDEVHQQHLEQEEDHCCLGCCARPCNLSQMLTRSRHQQSTRRNDASSLHSFGSGDLSWSISPASSPSCHQSCLWSTCIEWLAIARQLCHCSRGHQIEENSPPWQCSAARSETPLMQRSWQEQLLLTNIKPIIRVNCLWFVRRSQSSAMTQAHKRIPASDGKLPKILVPQDLVRLSSPNAEGLGPVQKTGKAAEAVPSLAWQSSSLPFHFWMLAASSSLQRGTSETSTQKAPLLDHSLHCHGSSSPWCTQSWYSQTGS